MPIIVQICSRISTMRAITCSSLTHSGHPVCLRISFLERLWLSIVSADSTIATRYQSINSSPNIAVSFTYQKNSYLTFGFCSASLFFLRLCQVRPATQRPSNNLSGLPKQHFFTGQMPVLSPNQQCTSTEG